MFQSKACALMAVALLAPAASFAQASPASGAEWPNYHRDPASTRYSPLDLITRDNVSRLAIAWSWKSDTTDSPAEIKSERRGAIR